MSANTNKAMCCTECQAENLPGQKLCWLCHGKLVEQPEIILAELAEPPPRLPFDPGYYALAVIFIVALVGLLAVGIGEDSPGLLVVYGVLVGPPLLATLTHSLLRTAMHKQVTVLQVLLTYICSTLVTVALTIIILAISIVYAFIAFFKICFGVH